MKFRSCTEQHQFLNSCLELMSMNPFLDTLTLLYFLRDTSDEPEKEIYGEKYFIRFETFAMNEMLGRPTPKVLDMNGFLLDSLKGNSDNLDRVLGFADSSLPPLSDQLRMNDIMKKILHAKGKDFRAIVVTLTVYRTDLFYEKLDQITKAKSRKIRQKENYQSFLEYQKLSKRNERADSTKKRKPEETDENATVGQVKKAKDFEHYRKNQRPARL